MVDGKGVVRKLEVLRTTGTPTRSDTGSPRGPPNMAPSHHLNGPQTQKGQVQGLRRLETPEMRTEHETAGVQPVRRFTPRERLPAGDRVEQTITSKETGDREADKGEGQENREPQGDRGGYGCQVRTREETVLSENLGGPNGTETQHVE